MSNTRLQKAEKTIKKLIQSVNLAIKRDVDIYDVDEYREEAFIEIIEIIEDEYNAKIAKQLKEKYEWSYASCNNLTMQKSRGQTASF